MSLSVREHMCLSIAGRQYKHAGRRIADARDLTGYTEPTFWLVVDRLLDRPEALAERPDVVPRLRRLRDARARARSPRRASSCR